MSKETAFHGKLAALTDEWLDLFGYWAPSVVTDTLEEYRACREAAALMDFSMLRKVSLDGPGALAFVNGLVTRDVSRLEPGRIAYGALCDEHGKMIDDCTVMMRSADSVRFCGANDRDFELFSARAAGTGIVVREHTDATPHLCLQGPRSREILQTLTTSDLSNGTFPYYTFREDVEIAGIPVFMTRLGYTAELGFELWVEADRALELWDALLEAGSPRGMAVIGMITLDLFRIEGGFIIGGVEYDPTVSPYECGLGWSVDLDKGEFQGRAGCLRDRDGTTLRLTSVVLESGGDDASGAPLSVDEREAGLVTQAVVSPHLGGRTLGLAKLHRDLREPGTRVVASVAGRDVPGEVVRHPVYDPERRRAKEL
ncbi:MAG: aminomethyl transferase family protein [Thermoleophilia bacterium]|nr:aminomethyl transferase family protein [Thermoleophilia bacterium]